MAGLNEIEWGSVADWTAALSQVGLLIVAIIALKGWRHALAMTDRSRVANEMRERIKELRSSFRSLQVSEIFFKEETAQSYDNLQRAASGVVTATSNLIDELLNYQLVPGIDRDTYERVHKKSEIIKDHAINSFVYADHLHRQTVESEAIDFRKQITDCLSSINKDASGFIEGELKNLAETIQTFLIRLHRL
jgi:hypothetical protein